MEKYDPEAIATWLAREVGAVDSDEQPGEPKPLTGHALKRDQMDRFFSTLTADKAMRDQRNKSMMDAIAAMHDPNMQMPMQSGMQMPMQGKQGMNGMGGMGQMGGM